MKNLKNAIREAADVLVKGGYESAVLFCDGDGSLEATVQGVPVVSVGGDEIKIGTRMSAHKEMREHGMGHGEWLHLVFTDDLKIYGEVMEKCAGRLVTSDQVDLWTLTRASEIAKGGLSARAAEVLSRMEIAAAALKVAEAIFGEAGVRF